MSENKYLIGMEYMDLLQKALVELGGEAPKKTVILKMKELLGDQLKESDRTFEVMAEYARQYLIEGNVMVKEKRGIWTLAKDGEQIEINDELRNKVIEIENTKEKAPRTAKGKRSKSTEDILRWCEPIVNALQTLGGAAKPDEVKKQIIEDVKPDEEYLKQTRGKNQINLFQNEVDFARGYLAQAGIIDKEIRGTWTLTDKAKGLVFDAETIEMIYHSWKANPKTTTEDSGNVMVDSDVKTVRYWIYSPGDNASQWELFYKEGIMAIGWDELGDLTKFDSKDEMRERMKECYGEDKSYRNAAHATWQFCNEISEDDVVFVKRGRTVLLGKGTVSSEYIFDRERETFKHVRKVKWLCKGEWDSPMQLAMKTLTDATSYTDDIEKINALFEDEIEEDEADKEVEYPAYTKEDFLKEVYLSEEKYDRLVKLLKMKKNLILQGAPGVGKTFAAKRLAYSMMGVKDISRVEMVQFHQSYSYEDFIVGYRPTGTGFKESYGPFYKFCDRAKDDLDNDYFFIIDEINRGNLSKIFGELFMLIEHDKRGAELSLLYVNEKFQVPRNVHIIGMMNTADRSLAMMDYALRRRFAFYEFGPAFESDQFKKYQKQVNHAKFDALIGCVKALNDAIEEDPALGRGFRVGHSYFCVPEDKIHMIDDEWIENVIDYELIPLLEEYWFDEPKKVAEWTDLLNACKKEAK